MTERDIQRELQNMQIETLRPAADKLVGWTVGIGIALLTLLIIANYAPATV